MFKRMKKMFKDEEGTGILGAVSCSVMPGIIGDAFMAVVGAIVGCAMGCVAGIIGDIVACPLGCWCGCCVGFPVIGEIVGAVCGAGILGILAALWNMCAGGAIGAFIDFVLFALIPTACICTVPVVGCGLGAAVLGGLGISMPCLAPLAALVAMIVGAFGCSLGSGIAAIFGSIGALGNVLGGLFG